MLCRACVKLRPLTVGWLSWPALPWPLRRSALTGSHLHLHACRENKIALRCVQNGDITLTDCFVPDSDRIPGGWRGVVSSRACERCDLFLLYRTEHLVSHTAPLPALSAPLLPPLTDVSP